MDHQSQRAHWDLMWAKFLARADDLAYDTPLTWALQKMNQVNTPHKAILGIARAFRSPMPGALRSVPSANDTDRGKKRLQT